MRQYRSRRSGPLVAIMALPAKKLKFCIKIVLRLQKKIIDFTMFDFYNVYSINLITDIPKGFEVMKTVAVSSIDRSMSFSCRLKYLIFVDNHT